jgi:hypothetical protein
MFVKHCTVSNMYMLLVIVCKKLEINILSFLLVFVPPFHRKTYVAKCSGAFWNPLNTALGCLLINNIRHFVTSINAYECLGTGTLLYHVSPQYKTVTHVGKYNVEIDK